MGGRGRMGSGVAMRWMGGSIEYGVRRERRVVMCVEQVIPDTMMDELEGTS